MSRKGENCLEKMEEKEKWNWGRMQCRKDEWENGGRFYRKLGGSSAECIGRVRDTGEHFSADRFTVL